MKHKDAYFSVVAVNHHHAKDAFLLTDYFAPRCKHFFLFEFGMAKDLESCNSIKFSEYCRGDLVRQKVLVRNQWGAFLPRYVQLVFWFTLFALRYAPRRSWIMAPHPPVFFFMKALRLLKQHEFVFIIADIFQYDEKSTVGRVFNSYVRRCTRDADNILYLSADIQERHEMTSKETHRLGVRKRWSLGIAQHFDVKQLMEKSTRLKNSTTTTIGYVGVVRSVVGIEGLIDCVERHDGIRLDIVGEGSFTKELKQRCEAPALRTKVVFHGFLPTNEVEVLARNWLCGAMLYDDDNQLYTRQTEPGKAKLYISMGLPVLMTDVSYIVDEIRQRKAGLVLKSNDPETVFNGIETIRSDYPIYVQGAIAMAQAHYFEDKYDDDFAFMKNAVV